MTRFYHIICLLASTLASYSSLVAEVKLPRILAHNMVLQQNQPVPIWGTALAGERVSVEFGNQTKKTEADAGGNWKIVLDAMPASALPRSMVITGTNRIRLDNILVGEVWLCSGQSNMEYTMRKNSKVIYADSSITSPVRELERASDDGIRIFLVTNKNLRDADSLHRGWSVARDSALRVFSAPAYFFAKNLRSKLRVPVAVISSAVPGSAIEPWLPASFDSAGTAVNRRWDSSRAGKFYPTMVTPLAPFAIKGFLWYQGETNCFQNETFEYTEKMRVLIRGWRSLWRNDALPFYYVQIAPFYYSKSAGKYPLDRETLPKFWAAQRQVLSVPNTGIITTTDLVDSPEDLHPGYKWEIGRRLALIALATTYGEQNVYSGPEFSSISIQGNTAEISFKHTDGGLVAKGGNSLSAFEIAGDDGDFVPATAVIRGDRVIVSANQIARPAAVRFEWNEGGRANLFNGAGLPAVPFDTRELKLKTKQ